MTKPILKSKEEAIAFAVNLLTKEYMYFYLTNYQNISLDRAMKLEDAMWNIAEEFNVTCEEILAYIDKNFDMLLADCSSPN